MQTNDSIGLPPVGVSGTVIGIWAEKADGTRRHLAGPFPNLVLDSGLDGMMGSGGSGPASGGAIYLSTDNTAPTNSGSGPSSPVAIAGVSSSSSTTTAAVTVGSDTYTRLRKTKTATGDIGGNTGTWASLLFRMADYGGSVYSWNFAHSLIKDGGGSPTTVTALSDERIVVQWAFDFYVKETPTVQATTILGNATNISWRPTELNSSSQWFELFYQDSPLQSSALNISSTPVTLTGGLPGGNLRTSNGTHVTYTPGSLSRTANYSAGVGSAGTINSVTLYAGYGRWQGILDVPITIIDANTFTWSLTMTMARATDLGIS